MRKEDSLLLRLMDLAGPWEVKFDHALELAKKCLRDEIFRLIIIRVAIDEAFVLRIAACKTN